MESLYRQEKQLGKGSFGSVWSAVHKKVKAPCAIKIVTKEKLKEKKAAKAAEKKGKGETRIVPYGKGFRDKSGKQQVAHEHTGEDAVPLPDGLPDARSLSIAQKYVYRYPKQILPP